ncbi:hypothetical protein [Enterocloster citroniae]
MIIKFCCLDHKKVRINLGLFDIEFKSKIQEIHFPASFRKVVNDVFGLDDRHSQVITSWDADYVIYISRYLSSISLANIHTEDSIEKIKRVMIGLSQKHEFSIILSYEQTDEEDARNICDYAKSLNIRVYNEKGSNI